MKRSQWCLCVLGLGLVATVLVAPARVVGGQATDTPALRVGVFDSRAVALAYGRSKEFIEWVDEQYARGKKLEAEGKKAELVALEREMKARQARMHRQVFGNSRIDDILEKVAPSLPQVAQGANVSVIVVAEVYHRPDVEIVDVTEPLVALFEPDEKTRKMIEDLRKHPPVSEEEAEREH